MDGGWQADALAPSPRYTKYVAANDTHPLSADRDYGNDAEQPHQRGCHRARTELVNFRVRMTHNRAVSDKHVNILYL